MIEIPAYNVEIPKEIKAKYGFDPDLRFSLADFFEEMQDCSCDNANAIAKIEESFTIAINALKNQGPAHPVFSKEQTWFMLHGGMFDNMSLDPRDGYIALKTNEEVNEALNQYTGKLDQACICLLDTKFPKDKAIRIFTECSDLTDDLYEKFSNSDDPDDNCEAILHP